MNTASFMKNSRIALGLTQEQLSIKIKKRRTNISLYETGRTIPPGDVVLKIFQLRFPKLCLLNTQFESDLNSEMIGNQSNCQKTLAS